MRDPLNPYLHLLDEFNAAECGTSGGERAHRRRGERVCDACRAAGNSDRVAWVAEAAERRPSKPCTAEQVKALTEHRAQRAALQAALAAEALGGAA